MHHDSRGTRWDLPPRRQSFFAGLDNDTVKFVYGVLRQAQKHQQQEQGREEAVTASANTAHHEHNKHEEGKDGTWGQVLREEGCCAESPTVIVEEAAVARDMPGDAAAEREEDYPTDQEEVNSPFTQQQQQQQQADEEEEQGEEKEQARPRLVDISLVHEFALQVATRQREITLLLASRALREWSSLSRRLRKTRAKVNHRFEDRERVRQVACQRSFLVSLKNYASEKERTRERATALVEQRRVDAARAVMTALATNLERGRSLHRAAEVLKEKNDAAEARRKQLGVLGALTRACEEAKVVHRKAEEMRADGRTRVSLEAFGAWARAAGLAGRLRKRLGRADRALLENVISAWALFSKHSAEKRLRKEERTAQRSRRALARAWDTEILDEAFFNWANLTAASKFHRLRLSARALRGWAAAARALASGAVVLPLRLSREKREVVLTAARKEADARFERATGRRLADVFEAWARGAGLASRLRRRLGESEVALMRNAFGGWKVFARHSTSKREARFEAKARKKREADTLRGVLWAWADVAAADKFFRVRLGHQVFTAWRNAILGDTHSK